MKSTISVTQFSRIRPGVSVVTLIARARNTSSRYSASILPFATACMKSPMPRNRARCTWLVITETDCAAAAWRAASSLPRNAATGSGCCGACCDCAGTGAGLENCGCAAGCCGHCCCGHCCCGACCGLGACSCWGGWGCCCGHCCCGCWPVACGGNGCCGLCMFMWWAPWLVARNDSTRAVENWGLLVNAKPVSSECVRATAPLAGSVIELYASNSIENAPAGRRSMPRCITTRPYRPSGRSSNSTTSATCGPRLPVESWPS